MLTSHAGLPCIRACRVSCQRGATCSILHLQATRQQQPAAEATNASAAVQAPAPTAAAPVAPSEDAAVGAAADHGDSIAVSDSDDMGSESEEEHTDRGWGTYSPIAAAIEAGRKVSCIHVLADEK